MIMNAAQVFMAGDEASSQRLTRRAKLNRDQKAAHDKLVAEYFADEPVYTDEMFRRRFRMSRRLFLRIAGDMAQSDPFFTLRYDARGQRGFTNLQKCTSAIRQLPYGYAPDALDEYLRMSERTALLCLQKFCEWECSGALIACTGRGRTAQLPGKSQIFDDLVAGTGPDTSFTVSGVEYRRGYYLADGIYPAVADRLQTDQENGDFTWNWSRHPESDNELKEWQECKDVLNLVRLSNDKDSWFWNDGESGSFSVKVVKKALVEDRGESFLPNFVWCKWVPLKFNIMDWRCNLDRLATRANLRRRNINITSVMCPFYDIYEETVDHLFSACVVSN
ncbi:uncharacterized protein LOC110875640 [Helianthus annuus]|uniref:uncharacterized protein LOC110875640 n=1 Tax=Helianthus annuus TaxID=4232 RepID=UPI000B8F47F1|nr:uncharacterized protein LOC110875640 [Helianthus annuus]